MPIEIPSEVALFLNCVGIPYPDINEDDVRKLAQEVRNFTKNVQGTHNSATSAINNMEQVYRGYSYRALVAAWAGMSKSHMQRLDELCADVATALDVAADIIVGVKIASLAELAALASAFIAGLVVSATAPGSAVILEQFAQQAAERICKAMEQTLIQYVVMEVLQKAIEPLEKAVGDMINKVVYHELSDLLDVEAAKNEPLHIEPDEVLRYADLLDQYADDIMQHAQDFANSVSGLDFTTNGGLELPGSPSITVEPSVGAPPPVDLQSEIRRALDPSAAPLHAGQPALASPEHAAQTAQPAQASPAAAPQSPASVPHMPDISAPQTVDQPADAGIHHDVTADAPADQNVVADAAAGAPAHQVAHPEAQAAAEWQQLPGVSGAQESLPDATADTTATAGAPVHDDPGQSQQGPRAGSPWGRSGPGQGGKSGSGPGGRSRRRPAKTTRKKSAHTPWSKPGVGGDSTGPQPPSVTAPKTGGAPSPWKRTKPSTERPGEGDSPEGQSAAEQAAGSEQPAGSDEKPTARQPEKFAAKPGKIVRPRPVSADAARSRGSHPADRREPGSDGDRQDAEGPDESLVSEERPAGGEPSAPKKEQSVARSEPPTAAEG